jgi:plastocyanin
MPSKTKHAPSRIVALLIATGLAIAATGCGETGDSDPTPVQTFKITPASGATTPPESTAEPAATETAEPQPSGTAPSGGVTTTIAIAGVSNEFDVEEVEAPAGTVVIEFDNRDGGVVHNIHFYRGSDRDGDDIAETELEAGPTQQTLTFDVQPGEYYYVCDAHPTTMEGTLTVE